MSPGSFDASLLTDMAGYRNRLVHEYDQVQADELFRILSEHHDDLAELGEVLRVWISRQPERMEREL